MRWGILAILGALLNMADAALTVIAIQDGLAVEANPLTRWVLGISIPLFFLLKIFVCALFMLLSGYDDQPLARYGIALGFTVYLSVVLYHSVSFLL